METPAMKIKTRFLLLSDTHSHPLNPPTSPSFAYRSPLPQADVLLHAGDLSFSGEIDEYRRTFEVLKSADAEVKIVIPGNHDLSLDGEYVRDGFHSINERERETWISKARELWTGKEALKAGILFLEEGVQQISLKNGAQFTIYTNPYTPEFGGMSFSYERHDDRFNPSDLSLTNNFDFEAPNPCPSWPAIDIMLTHGPPLYHMDDVGFEGREAHHVGCANQLHALRRVRPRLSVFGHIHEGWGAQRVTWEHGNGNSSSNGSKAADGHGDPYLMAVGQVQKVEVSSQDVQVLQRGYAHVDASTGGRPLNWGKESLLVNAAIMNMNGEPGNAPWVIDLDLPRAELEDMAFPA